MFAWNENCELVVTDHEARERKINWGKDFHYTELTDEQKELIKCIAQHYRKLTFRRVYEKLKVVYWTKFGASENESLRFTNWLKELDKPLEIYQ